MAEEKKMTCSKCGSQNYAIQREVSKIKQKKGCFYFFIMNVLFGFFYWMYLGMKWMLKFFVWVFFLVPIRLIKKQPLKMPQISHRTMAVCQNCGNAWKV